MKHNAVVRARIDSEIKEEASTILAAIGLTVSDAFRMMLIRVVKEHSLPFDPLIPNKETVNAMREVRAGKTTSTTVDNLLDSLNEDN